MSDSLIVEFVGLPGSGKSTLAVQVVDTVEIYGNEPCSPIAEINGRPTLSRFASKAVYAGRRGITTPLTTATTIRSAGLTRLFSTADARSVLFNWLFVCGAIERYRRSENVVILDQGLLQAYWSAHLSESDELCDDIRRGILDTYAHGPVLVVDVRVSTETIKKRLNDRDPNPSRVKPDQDGWYSLADATRAYTRTRDLIDDVIEQNDDAKLLTLSNENIEDLEPNIESVSNRLRSYF